MISKIENIIKSLTGTLVGYGLKEEKLLTAIQKNKKITECHLLNSIDLGKETKGYLKKKKIDATKLKKIYGHKGVKTMLVDAEQMRFQEKKLISKFIYITSNYIYIYNVQDTEKLIKKCKRYHTNVEVLKNKEGIILKVDISESKKHPFLDKIYFLFDSVIDLFDIISEILIS